MNIESVIERVGPNEMQEAQHRMTSIRFDCFVKMFDCGQKFTKPGWPSPAKPLPPQWFKSESKLSMEAVAHLDPYTLGAMIKEQFEKLNQCIGQYEKS